MARWTDGRKTSRIASLLGVGLSLVVPPGLFASDASNRRQVADWLGASRTSVAPRGIPGAGPGPVMDAIAWLEANQGVDGSWGGTLPLVETSAVVETLASVEPDSPALAAGASWLASQMPANTDFLARRTAALADVVGFETTAAVGADTLLALRNPVEPDSGLPNWPEGGWGLAPGFETDSMTTALALLALDRTGFNGGFAVSTGVVPAGGSSVQVWDIPADATRVSLLVTVGGSDVRLCMTEGAPPPFCNPYFPLPPGGPYLIVFPDSGLPFTPGTNYVVVESPSPPALAATYSMTASYETPTFDTLTLAEPLDYLLEAQNVDGGWGIQRGQPSELYTTQHVLLALLRYAAYDLDGVIADGIAWLETQQLGDGSFGYGGPGIPYVTALAALDLARSEHCVFGSATDDAIGALLATQDVDGSWLQEPYDTALAALALAEYGDDLDADGIRSDGDCSGSTTDNPCPDGVTAGCDDNCGDLPNPLQENVDGDARGDLCDCDSGNAQAWARAGEVALHVARLDTAGTAEIEWLPPTSPGTSLPPVYDLLQAAVPSDFVTATVCLASDDLGTLAVDPAIPASGTGFAYLVRAENGCPVAGTLGDDSSGAERSGISCP